MIISGGEEIVIYESPDGGKTVYSRRLGADPSTRSVHYVDPTYKKEQELNRRWANLKEAVFMADSDPTINDALEKLEMVYALKKKEVK
jgi:hypothetical protein